MQTLGRPRRYTSFHCGDRDERPCDPLKGHRFGWENTLRRLKHDDMAFCVFLTETFHLLREKNGILHAKTGI